MQWKIQPSFVYLPPSQITTVAEFQKFGSPPPHQTEMGKITMFAIVDIPAGSYHGGSIKAIFKSVRQGKNKVHHLQKKCKKCLNSANVQEFLGKKSVYYRFSLPNMFMTTLHLPTENPLSYFWQFFTAKLARIFSSLHQRGRIEMIIIKRLVRPITSNPTRRHVPIP